MVPLDVGYDVAEVTPRPPQMTRTTPHPPQIVDADFRDVK